MTIRSRTATLDDVSGDLTLALAKLEMEAAHGTANADEQIDFVRDISRAALEKEVRPWRARAIQALVLGLICLAGAVALPATQVPAAVGIPALFGLAGLGFLLAGGLLMVYFRRRRHEDNWLQEKEAAIAAGRAILEER